MIRQGLKTMRQNHVIGVRKKAPTGEVSADSRLHQRLHPFPDDELLIMAEIMGLVRIMNEPEPISARVYIFIGNHSIPKNIDVALDLGFLWHPVNTTPL